MTDTAPAFILTRPRHWANGVIFASPHSGCIYPDWFLASSRLPLNLLRSSEDAFIDRLIACAPDFGAVALSACYPRALVDLNRGTEEIDPLVVTGAPRAPQNQRTMAGLGVIPRVVSQGRTIHKKPITRSEADRRLAAYWHPYHDALSSLITEAHRRFGQAVLIDMHSMPRDALGNLSRPRPDIVLGNRHGKSASAHVSDAVTSACEDEGWQLRRNSPFSGAYIASTYGAPARNIHVVQLEIDRSLYMDEATLTPLPEFDDVAARISRIVRRLSVLDCAGRPPRSVAAE
ncbi:N-formylglutamate amidohydrolase [Paracoccus tegillarcae]|uniref:N-formylglutamate amidohydrolase n=1 Tax=Paracoccus tegillarcae TaxID=1529068 RepID=A0A2K9EW93_9RHOB|nr:N-formylglutamate amidohydrolase [Paracoccus tegillarcae]AUH33554.1 N-formylglutamate amidohydrolase [Paracoccus tegillarcae]